ncbi:ycf20-like protein [Abrus precatorius]|uniref:Ycf20-like protein n=1 Tax=Abrus precatorius TaxID=3816 RepID=A0A8B8KNR0_ABRPR|nr:ycf20-like protein [Abrus precatorius]XP_027345464.1 ycf20-like protein [Abrus precatorius]XP_027345465.1 ycf20-like protein [Abrus precatorius]XP_027345466.1 ycf20-like protein [Abrus precatorius]
MACKMGSMILRWRLSTAENESSDNSHVAQTSSRIYSCCCEPRFYGLTLKVGMKSSPFAQSCFLGRRAGWKIAFALNTGGVSNNGEQQSLNDANSNFGGTRLGRILTAGGRQLLEKLNSARKNFPMKIFLLLLGFYTANALATILGQTGDWDVLVAGVVVAAIEGIGMLIYRKPPTVKTGRLQSFLVMVNYWKAGICLGLFVDAFKLGS